MPDLCIKFNIFESESEVDLNLARMVGFLDKQPTEMRVDYLAGTYEMRFSFGSFSQAQRASIRVKTVYPRHVAECYVVLHELNLRAVSIDTI